MRSISAILICLVVSTFGAQRYNRRYNGNAVPGTPGGGGSPNGASTATLALVPAGLNAVAVFPPFTTTRTVDAAAVIFAEDPAIGPNQNRRGRRSIFRTFRALYKNKVERIKSAIQDFKIRRCPDNCTSPDRGTCDETKLFAKGTCTCKNGFTGHNCAGPRPNALTLEERNQFLPVMKALLKVMENSTVVPEDVNTLLVLTRDLTKDLPEGSRALPGFDGFNIDEMGLVEDGDVIVDVDGVPHVLTQFGAFPLSDVSLMTDEERERFLPATKTFISVLEKEWIDENEINKLLSQSEELQELIPEQWRGLIRDRLVSTFGAQRYNRQHERFAPSSNLVNVRTRMYTGRRRKNHKYISG